MRSGIVTVIGRPNVGKSSLINAVLGKKVAIVSHKPQTTRHRIQGVLHSPEGQIVFVDTPGMHQREAHALNRYMNQTAVAALNEVDLVLFVVEAQRWSADDAAVLAKLEGAKMPVGLVINKIDKLKDKAQLLQEIESHSHRREFAFIVPLSALKRENLEGLVSEIQSRLPEGPALYPEDQLTGHDQGFAAAEIVREKLTRSLHQELPYALTVTVEKFVEEPKFTRIDAVIWVERDGQKKIVIGAGGETLKGIGSAARRDLEKLVGRKVFLKLWCKVKENWSDDPQALKRFGYLSE
jgi:GTP-binding protein Era